MIKLCKQMDRRITKTFEEVCQDIQEKKSVDHVGAYELMKHDKMKQDCFARLRPQGDSPNPQSSSQQDQNQQFYSIENPASWPASTIAPTTTS